MPAPRVSAPAKVILLGEWSVLEGGPSVASTLNTRFSVDLAPGDGPALEINAGSEGRWTWDPGARTEAPPFFRLAQLTLENLQPLAPAHSMLFKGGRLKIQRSWKIEEGLGSSSALVACLLGLAFWDIKAEHTPSPESTWLLGRELIRLGQGGKGSGLDLATQLWGGTLLMEGKKPKSHPLSIPPELMLVHTGQKTSTAQALATVEPDPGALREIAQATQTLLDDGDWPGALARHFDALNALGVVPPNVAELRQQWRGLGYIEDLKTTGAGGGDALLIWVRPEQKATFIKELATHHFYPCPYGWGGKGLSFG